MLKLTMKSPLRPAFKKMKPSPLRKTKIFLIFLVILALIISIWLGKKNLKEIKSSLVQLRVVENHQNDSYYDELAEKLIMCESAGDCLTIVPMDGGSASMGCLQWKPETFKEYALKYGVIGEKASLNYIMTIIWDRKINKYLAIQILKNEPEKAKQLWYNCWRKINKK
jgi:hypothetical protein